MDVNSTVASQSLEALELPSILEMAGRHACWSGGVAALAALRPFTDRERLLVRLAEVAEAIRLDEAFENMPIRGMRDVMGDVQAASRGQTLEPASLLDVGNVLRVAANVRRFLEDRREQVPTLTEYGSHLVAHARLQAEIEATFDSEGTMHDAASPRLESLRLQIRTLQNRVTAKLQGILRNPSNAKIFQDPYVTTRQDRYVLPIKAEYRSSFNGLVLDASASGATLFMEPYEVVELDNDLRTLRVSEQHEVQRILEALTDRVSSVADDVEANAQVLAHLDMLSAIARFGAEQHARLVPIDDASSLVLRQARHPLLGSRAIPIDIEVGRKARVVVITGPNTGGKTVTLKTVGLLGLMAMCGLPLPVGDGSRVGFLRGVFADIGDEQSIAQNLSTFSSHLTRIARILPCASEQTLVVLDEVGAGTDPREGTGLAVALLEHLCSRGAMVVATTHYNELKTFAANFEGAVNAAMEFDPVTLQPTYRILMGVPGRSCAIEIAARLGLPEPLLDRARELLGTAHFSLEELLANLEVEREEQERQQSRTEAAWAAAEQSRLDAQRERDRVDLWRAESEKAAAGEARALIDAAREESRQILADARRRLGTLFAAAARERKERAERAGSAPAPAPAVRSAPAPSPPPAPAVRSAPAPSRTASSAASASALAIARRSGMPSWTSTAAS